MGLMGIKRNKKAPETGALVTAEGFEPPTVGAEIQYSIQLNYAALIVYLERDLHTSQNLCTKNFVAFVRLVF